MTTTSARRVPELTWHEDHTVRLTRGERAADRMRNVMGSWPFVGGFVLFMALWAIANTVLPGWDVYPFILLNLFLSMLAGLQGAILLIAAKRQDAVAAALARHDYETNIAAKTDIETLLEINRNQMQLIAELHALLIEREADAPRERPIGTCGMSRQNDSLPGHPRERFPRPPRCTPVRPAASGPPKEPDAHDNHPVPQGSRRDRPAHP